MENDLPASSGSMGCHYQVEDGHLSPHKGHGWHKFRKHPSSQAQAASDRAVQTLLPFEKSNYKSGGNSLKFCSNTTKCKHLQFGRKSSNQLWLAFYCQYHRLQIEEEYLLQLCTDIKNILLFLYKNNCFTDSLRFERQLSISSRIEQWPVLRYEEINVSMEKWRNRISISFSTFFQIIQHLQHQLRMSLRVTAGHALV